MNREDRMKVTGVELVDVFAGLALRRILRTGPKRTRKKRVRKFLKEFYEN